MKSVKDWNEGATRGLVCFGTNSDEDAEDWRKIFTKPAEDPEKRLYIALLEDAIAVLEGRVPPKDFAEEYRITVDWVKGTNDSCRVSFETVCSVLSLNVSAVRKALLSGTELRES
jgi:hypothetical protein